MRVVVVGSGAAGSAAALAACTAGAEVVVLEGASRFGGTTSYSGGVSWLPGNHVAAAAGIRDSAEMARDYLHELALGDVDHGLVRTFVAGAAPVASWLEHHSDLSWQSLDYPDYHPERRGGLRTGRSLEPVPTRVSRHVLDRVRVAPTLTEPVAYGEIGDPTVDALEIERRHREGILAAGRGLIGILLSAVERGGGELLTGARVKELRTDAAGRVRGVVTQDGSSFEGRVILATGGFERDADLVRRFLRMPDVVPVGSPTSLGDGLRLAMGAGAELGNMSEAWWCPAAILDQASYEGDAVYRLLLTERIRPRSLIIDSQGRRYADESRNYNDFGRAMHDFDPATFSFPRASSWLVFDDAYRRRYHLGPLRRDAPDPDWLRRGGTLAELAESIAVPAPALGRTVSRFNALAAAGQDDDLGRGDSAYEQSLGDPTAAHPTLGPVDQAPFYALEVRPGTIGTKGGPRTDADGRVRSMNGGYIDGLFAVGNVAASPFGLLYPGAGGTIGPMLVFGVRAGTAAAA